MEQWTRFRQFVTATWSELKKTSWPSKKEVTGTTLVVIVFVVVCALYLWVVDLGLNWGVTRIFEVFR